MKPKVQLFRVSATLILAAVSLAPAGIREKGYEVGVYGGIEDGDHHTNVPAGRSYGMRAAYAFTRKIMAEFTVDAFPASRDLVIRIGDPSIPIRQVPASISPNADFLSYTLGITANFLTERDVKTNPYFNVSLGFMTESRSAGTFSVQTNPNDPNSVVRGGFLAEKDTGTALTVAAGARTFFTPSMGIRYDLRYIHNDTFRQNQDGFQVSVGATFVVGGKK
jgi:hypothetical protein